MTQYFKGISMNELDSVQKEAAMNLLKTCLSNNGYNKVHDIMQLEIILKALEHREAKRPFCDSVTRSSKARIGKRGGYRESRHTGGRAWDAPAASYLLQTQAARPRRR